MKALVNNHNMFGDELNNEQVEMVYKAQKRQLLEAAGKDDLFEDQKITVVEYGKDQVRVGILHGNKKAYVYLGMAEDHLNMPRYKYQVVVNSGVDYIGAIPLYVTDDLEYAEELLQASIDFARRNAGEEAAEFIKDKYAVREVA